MINQLGELEQPEWLARSSSGGQVEFPELSEMLSSSLFYPASGFDGRPIQYLAGNVLSFVYADYGVTREQLISNLEESGFEGYEIAMMQSVPIESLGCIADLVPAARKNTVIHAPKAPFCEWIIFRRDKMLGPDHGPPAFSLLYLCFEGVAAFDALYVQRKIAPTALAIIQPGTGFGGNWTDFKNPNSDLAKCVMQNPAGLPNYLLFGGIGGRDFYQEACWPEFNRSLGFLGTNQIHLFARGALSEETRR